MIRIKTFRAYFDSIKNRIGEITLFKTVADEDELSKHVKELTCDDIVLVAVIPSATNTGAGVDDITEKSNILFFLLQKINKSDHTDDEFDDKIDNIQVVMTKVKELMIEDKLDCDDKSLGYHLLHNLDPAGWRQDYESNLCGCYGWSLSFAISVVGC